MALEQSFAHIGLLNPAWPTGTDLVKTGDDHIRGVKNAIIKTFPQINAPLTISSTKMNQLDSTIGLSGNLMTIKTDVDMQAKKITNLANATGQTDAMNVAFGDGRYVRPNIASSSIALKNDNGLVGQTSDGAHQWIIGAVRGDNAVQVGDSAAPLRLASSTTPIYNNSPILTQSSLAAAILNILYPVGSIYLTTNGDNPGNKLGGTWVKLDAGYALVTADGSGVGTWGIAAGTGGTSGVSKAGVHTVTLSAANLAAHTHSTPGHTHGMSHGHSASFAGTAVAAHTHTINHDHPAANTTDAGGHTHTIRSNYKTGNNQEHTAEGYFVGKTYSMTPNAGMSHEQVMFFQEGTYPNEANVGSQRARVETVANHHHTVDIPNFGGNSGAGGAHTPSGSVSVAALAANVQTGTGGASNTGSAGTGSAFSVQPPAISIYAWRRTA